MASYEVYISHRGLVIKKGLANHLHHALKARGISSFLDLEDFSPGQVVRNAMLAAARTALIGVPIFTEDYGSSGWCLDELAELMDSHRNHRSKLIPVYYDVKPQALRMKEENGSFAQNFPKYVNGPERIEEDRMERWKSALHDASWVAGVWLEDYGGREGELIDALVQNIVKEMANRLPVNRLPTAVGLDGKVQDVMQRFRLHEKESVYVVLLWGTGGIGKSTLARAIYDTHRYCFQASCLVENCGVEKALQIQARLRRDLLLDGNEIMGDDLARGRARLKHGLRSKKVLIVLDDMKRLDGMNSDFSSVQEILDPTSLCPGSLILLTSRDQRLFPHRNDLSDVFRGETYELPTLDPQESRKLFCLHASPDPDFEELVKEAVEACHGLPLALEVLGRHLRSTREKTQWEEAIHKLRSNENTEISGKPDD